VTTTARSLLGVCRYTKRNRLSTALQFSFVLTVHTRPCPTISRSIFVTCPQSTASEDEGSLSLSLSLSLSHVSTNIRRWFLHLSLFLTQFHQRLTMGSRPLSLSLPLSHSLSLSVVFCHVHKRLAIGSLFLSFSLSLSFFLFLSLAFSLSVVSCPQTTDGGFFLYFFRTLPLSLTRSLSLALLLSLSLALSLSLSLALSLSRSLALALLVFTTKTA